MQAGLKLVKFLSKYKDQDVVLVAIPKGGVEVAQVIAQQLNVPLDYLPAKKILHPVDKEQTIGAVCVDAQVLVDIKPEVSAHYIENETEKIKKQLRTEYNKISKYKSHVADLAGKTVILIDEGISTGFTMMAAVQNLRSRGVKKVVIAVPVAPIETVIKLKSVADEVICISTPPFFVAIEDHYEIRDKSYS